MSSIIYVGVDTSKGYADVCFQNDSGSILTVSDRYNDLPNEHEALRQAFMRLEAPNPGVKFIIGIECTGGLERNFLQTFRSLECSKTVYRLNALAVKRFLARDLHRNVTDEISAKGIAAYLRSGLRPADVPYEPELEGERGLCRYVLNMMMRSAQISNQLQSLLPSVHPYLVQYCRGGIPQWVLHLLKEYPTAVRLAAADPEDLYRIRYIKHNQAHRIVKAAQESIAALRDESTGLVVSGLARQVLELGREAEVLKKHLWQQLKDDQETKILKSIKGVGRWTASILRLEVGSFERFHSAGAVVAFAGLDPRVRQSGDGEKHMGISHAGKSQIRACLYMPMLAAVSSNPVFKEFYQRLRSKGKSHLVAITACMAKLLRIAYACIVSCRIFDSNRHEQVKVEHETRRQQQAEVDRAKAAAAPEETGSLEAPVSWREAKRRRQRAATKARVIVCGG